MRRLGESRAWEGGGEERWGSEGLWGKGEGVPPGGTGPSRRGQKAATDGKEQAVKGGQPGTEVRERDEGRKGADPRVQGAEWGRRDPSTHTFLSFTVSGRLYPPPPPSPPMGM